MLSPAHRPKCPDPMPRSLQDRTRDDHAAGRRVDPSKRPPRGHRAAAGNHRQKRSMRSPPMGGLRPRTRPNHKPGDRWVPYLPKIGTTMAVSRCVPKMLMRRHPWSPPKHSPTSDTPDRPVALTMKLIKPPSLNRKAHRLWRLPLVYRLRLLLRHLCRSSPAAFARSSAPDPDCRVNSVADHSAENPCIGSNFGLQGRCGLAMSRPPDT